MSVNATQMRGINTQKEGKNEKTRLSKPFQALESKWAEA